MRPGFLATMILAALPALSGCGYSVVDAAEDISESSDSLSSGKPIPNKWSDTGTFTALAARGPDNVVFTIGDKFQIRAEGDAEVLDKLRFTLEGGKLVIARSNDNWYKMGPSSTATIYVTAPSLATVSAAGSGKLKAERLSGDKVSLSAAGSGDIEVAVIETKSVDVDVAGSGNIRVAGKATNASYSIAGSGNVEADELVSSDVSASIAGSGYAALNATTTADISVAGSGEVKVTGGAKCTKSVMGSGKVDCS